MPPSEILAVGAGELSVVLLLLCVVVVPVAGIAFARSGKAYSEIGKGQFAVDFDESEDGSSHEELRQLVEAKAYRQLRRGEQPVDVESEVERLLNGAGSTSGEDSVSPELDQIRAEIRQVVIARNESRLRRGQDPLDVEAEVARMLEEFG